MVLFQVDYNTYLKAYESTYPLFLQDRNISREEYNETLNYMSKRTAEIHHKSSAWLWIFWIIIGAILIALFSASMALVGEFTSGTFQTMLFITFPVLFMIGLVISVFFMFYLTKKFNIEKMKKYEDLKKELENECSRKYHSKGVQIVLKFKGMYSTEDHSQVNASPYLEVLVSTGQTASQNYQQNDSQYYQSNVYQQDQPQSVVYGLQNTNQFYPMSGYNQNQQYTHQL
eukprot:gene755-9007_t